MRMGTDNGGEAQTGYKAFLKLIRNEITALAVGSFLEGIAHFGGDTVFVTSDIPKRFFVSVGCTADLGIGWLCGFRLGSKGRADGDSHFTLHGIKAFLPLNLPTEIYDLLFHGFIGGGINR